MTTAPHEPGGAFLLDEPGRFRLWAMRHRLRRRNGWPYRETLCRCGELFPAEIRRKLCPKCRR